MTEIRLEDIFSIQQLDEILKQGGRKQRSVYLRTSLIRLAEDLAFILSYERRGRVSFNDLVEEALYEKLKRYIEERASPLRKEKIEISSMLRVSELPAPPPIVEEPAESCFFCGRPAVSLIMKGKIIRAVCEQHKRDCLESGWTDRIESIKCFFCERPSSSFILKKDERDRNIYPACEQHVESQIKSGLWRPLKKLEGAEKG